MLLPIEFASVNERTQLRPGRYGVTCLTFVSSGQREFAFQFEYRLEGDPAVVAIDMVFIGIDGTVRAADFLRMPDLGWRDNFGARSDALDALLPQEILSMQLARVDDAGVQNIGEAS
ncbi:hypothetical protein [Burkholderia cepacia]|uniref:hypothetical protein n=1 Tax=Burkholderia cepacia TaxID=292 RepID=UPI0006677B97|nr:hypothetical protein [Burkholderia cepacia]